MARLIQVQPLKGFSLYLEYEDGVKGQVDLSSLVGQGVFSCWSNPASFEAVTIGPGGEVQWSDEVELCPDALYLQLTGKHAEDIYPNLGAAADA